MTSKKGVACQLMQTAQRMLGQQPSPQQETRWRLLQAAAEVFAEVGYHAATTREICKRAGVNLASIHYYYGDKAELYREVFRLPFLDECNTFIKLDLDSTSLPEALHAFYAWFFPPDAADDPMTPLFMRLHAREDADPSGVLGDAMVQAYRPNHERLQAILCRELGVKKVDDEVDRLALALVGLATVYFHNRKAVDAFALHLVSGQKSMESMTERLTGYAIALIDSERKRRTAAKTRK